VSALAYAYDNVLVAPSPLAMRRLRAICDAYIYIYIYIHIYAVEYDIVINSSKSKCLVIAPAKHCSF